MRLNMEPGKTEMMIFGVSDSRRTGLKEQQAFMLAGQPVRYVAQYKYLGCHVHERWLYGADFNTRASRVLVQTLMMRRELDHLSAARSVRLGLRLYDVKVKPSATYGSCVWGTRFHMVSPTSAVIHNELEKRHRGFMRSWCHLRGSEPTWLMYRELGRLPLHYFWWRDVVRFANRVLGLPDGSIWKEMLQDSCQSSCAGKKCWAGEVDKFLGNVGCDALSGQAPLDEDNVLAALCRVYDQVWDGLCRYPRQAPDRAKLATYFAWFDSGAWLRRPKYMFLDLPASATCTYLRFRLGTHDLQVELGRWQDPRPRDQRFCRRCSMRAIDDERHLVFECPAFEYLRAARRHLFTSRVALDMACFMRQRDQAGVLHYVLDCLRHIAARANVDHSLDVDLPQELSVEPDSYDSD